jgi:hypothetical protein
MSGSFRYRGDLSETSLPEVFGIIERYGVPGMIEVTQGGMVKRVYVRGGHVVHATSSDPADRLSEHVRMMEILDEESVQSLDTKRSNSSQRLGVLLVERGLLSPSQVHEAICGQIEEIVWSLFAWREGEVTFESGDFGAAEQVQIKLPMRRVSFEGIKRAAALPAIEELGGWEARLEPSFRYEELIDIGLDAEEMDLLRRVDGRRTIDELCAVGPYSSGENAMLLFAFKVLSLVCPASKSVVSEDVASDISVEA